MYFYYMVQLPHMTVRIYFVILVAGGVYYIYTMWLCRCDIRHSLHSYWLHTACDARCDVVTDTSRDAETPVLAFCRFIK
jgi:hypothetical protein